MNGEITGLCRDHSFEQAIDLCRLCGAEFCEGCLVYPFRKPLCKTCAIAAAGVRSGGSHKPLNKRIMRKRLQAFKTVKAVKRPPEEDAPVLTDPIAGHDPIGPPSGEGMDRLGEPDPMVALDPDLVAEAAAQLTGPAQAPAEETTDDEPPGGDIAPPIDWSNPFG